MSLLLDPRKNTLVGPLVLSLLLQPHYVPRVVVRAVALALRVAVTLASPNLVVIREQLAPVHRLMAVPNRVSVGT